MKRAMVKTPASTATKISPPRRISFAIDDALEAAIATIPEALRSNILRVAFSESVYAIADSCEETGGLNLLFRFVVEPGWRRGIAHETAMGHINAALDIATTQAQTEQA